MLEYYLLFPIGLVIATMAMSSGVAGSNFWIPVYLLWLKLEPREAFWTSLLTMLFGFGSGAWRNYRAGTIDFQLVRAYGKLLWPAAVVGALLSPRLPITPLLLAYSAFVTVYGAYLAATSWRSGAGEASLLSRHELAWGRALLAGWLQGAIAIGAGSLMMPVLLRHRVRQPADAVGATVVLVLFASLISATLRIDAALWRSLTDNAEQIASMMLFAVPGVVIGGQIGPRFAALLPLHWLRRYIAIILLVIGVLVARRALG